MDINNKNLSFAVIEGYAALFNKPDLAGDILKPESLSKYFLKKSIPASKNVPMMLYQHKVDCPIGRWSVIKVDKKGLFVQGIILLNSPSAYNVYALIAGGAINGLSIGFRTIKANKNRQSNRVITDIDLWEISVVSFPMVPDARISYVSEPQDFKDPARTGLKSTQPARRASFPPSGARQFADALQSAANMMS